MKKFTCGHCGGRIAVNPRHLGTLVVCPECGKPTHPLAGDILAASKNGPPTRALSAAPVERLCENCGRTIGRLERLQVWNNHLVCDECHPRLSRALPTADKGAMPTGASTTAALPGPAPTNPPADAALAVVGAKAGGKSPVKRAGGLRKGRGKGTGPAALPAGPFSVPLSLSAPVPAEGGVTAMPSASTPQAASSVPTLVFDRPADRGLVGPLSAAGAAVSSAAAAAAAVAPIAVTVARAWPWRRNGRAAHPASPPPTQGQLRNRLIGLSVAAVVAGAALYGALTLLLAVAGFITKLAIGLLAFGGVVVGLWLAVTAVRRYVPWPLFRRGSGGATGATPAGDEVLVRRE
jgi:predicted RNA-binding Zn-ribbon protein involved in translation (DUF1610 family)